MHNLFTQVSRLSIPLAVVLVAAAAGCGGSGLPSLTGSVTIDGKPAPAGVAIQFSPTAEGSPSYAQTDANGKYEAQFSFNKTGIQLGEHSVKLIPGSVEAPMPEIGPDGRPVGPAPKSPMADLPKSYWEEIEVIQVTPGSNTHDINLTTQ